MKLVLFIIQLLFVDIKSANILGVFPASGYSQFILAKALMQELATRGHQVTVISSYAPKSEIENYRTILIDNVIDVEEDLDLFGMEQEDIFTQIMTTYKFGNALTEGTLKNKNVQDLLNSEESFDLVIVEQFFSDALKGFAAHFNAPLVLFSSMGVTEWNKYAMGNPALPSMSAVCFTSHNNHMSFLQRFRNIYATVFDSLYRTWVVNSKQQEYLNKYFPKPINLDEITYNASLMLLNSHVTTSENSLLPYNMIEIGGFHVVQKPLSKQIQEYLDSAEDGAILFSMGSNLNSSDLSEETLNGIFNAFGKLKQKILWKFEKDLPNKPSNIFISKWLKQSDILAHPNVRLFITHGGLLSTTEAIFYGVPMVGIPIFGDQKMNMARASQNGIAKVISFQELSEETLSSAINEVIGNAKFQDNARKMSNLIRDRVVRPMDLAIYWIEYVIRHKGYRFDLPTLHMSWLQVYMIDIFLFITSVFLLIFVVLNFAFKLLRNKKCKTVQTKNNVKKSKKKQH